MNPGPCRAPSSLPGAGGPESVLESSLPQSDSPCLIVEDSQPDGIGLEDDPEQGYRALLTQRLTTLQASLPPRGPSPELELISSPVGSRHSQTDGESQCSVSGGKHRPLTSEMNPSFEESEVLDVLDKRGRSEESESRGASQTHEEGASMFGFLELSQSQDFGSEPDRDQAEFRAGSGTSPKALSKPGPQVSVDVLLHSQNRDQDQSHEELASTQEDMFDKKGAAPDPGLPNCTPSRSLALLHLSGGVQGTLVDNSFSQSSADFVAPTPDNFTPMIVPSSPTDLPRGDEPMDTPLPPVGQSQRREQPGPASSTPVSQNTPGFEPECPLSVPSQPEFSHDVFAPTQSQNTSSENLGASALSESSLNLRIHTELQDDDEATQIEHLEDNSSLKSSSNSQDIQLSQSAVNIAGKLMAGSQNSLRTSGQDAKHQQETPEPGANSHHGSHECSALDVNDENVVRFSQGSAKASSQPMGSAQEAVLQTHRSNVNNEKKDSNLGHGIAKANGQPTGSVQEAIAGSQTHLLDVNHEKKHADLSQGSAKANSQPIRFVQESVAKSQAQVLNVALELNAKSQSQGSAKANSQPVGSVTKATVHEEAALSASQPTAINHRSAKANSQPAGSAAGRGACSQSKSPKVKAGAEREASPAPGAAEGQMAKSDTSGAKTLDSSGEISFHFTLPKEGDLIGPSIGATPPQLGQLKQSVRHSTPIELNSVPHPELNSLSQSSVEGGAEAAEGGAEAAEGGAEAAAGKLSLRMKMVTPVEEGSERFSLQRPAPNPDHEAGPKSMGKSCSPSVFSRVRQVHRRDQDEDSAPRMFPSPQRNSEYSSLPGSQPDSSAPCASVANQDGARDPSHHAPGAAHSHNKMDPETPPLRRAGPAHRRHVRTIQEVRTTVTRIITDVYYEDGKEVDRTVTQESDEPVVQFQVMDVSPSRTGSSSVTSGDLADISSSTCTTGTASTGTTERPEFLPPPSRGAKARRVGFAVGAGGGGGGGVGQRKSPGSGSNSPRGKAKRGRPPSRSSPHSRAPPAGAAQDSLAQIPASDSDPGSGSSFVGLRVVAKWSSNAYFYSGRIIEDRGVQGGPVESGSGPEENRFRLRFDDGYECELWARDILLCDPIPLETEVTALNPDQTYTTGVVRAHRMEGQELQYCVEHEEQRVWFCRSSVILSLDQGNRLREHHSLGPYHPHTPLSKASDISLDNLVEGKRRRRAGPSGPSTPTRSPRTRTKPSPGPGSDSNPGPAPGSKRKLSSDRTPAAKRERRGAVLQMAPLNTSDSDPPLAACDHAPGACNLSCDLVTTHGPRPLNPALFEGFVFLLTASSEPDRISNRHDGDDHEELVQTGPYNKTYTESQLQTGGGIILKEFNHQQCEAAYRSLLIADQHCRNRTYLLCVASGVPCVSHLWVRDCCHDNSLLNYRNYLLPAGAGPEGGVREWRPRSNPFKSLRVLLLLEDQVQFWSQLVQLGGGTVLVRSPQDQSEFPADSADVLVLGPDPGPLPGPDLPRVSVDWIVYSVVCGETLDFTGSSFGPDSLSSSSS